MKVILTIPEYVIPKEKVELDIKDVEELYERVENALQLWMFKKQQGDIVHTTIELENNAIVVPVTTLTNTVRVPVSLLYEEAIPVVDIHITLDDDLYTALLDRYKHIKGRSISSKDRAKLVRAGLLSKAGRITPAGISLITKLTDSYKPKEEDIELYIVQLLLQHREHNYGRLWLPYYALHNNIISAKTVMFWLERRGFITLSAESDPLAGKFTEKATKLVNKRYEDCQLLECMSELGCRLRLAELLYPENLSTLLTDENESVRTKAKQRIDEWNT